MQFPTNFPRPYPGKILFGALLLTISAFPAAAGTLAVTPSGTLVDSQAPYALTTAWDFTVTQTFHVTALDFYSNGSAYADSHPVGLWAANTQTGYAIGTLIATVTFGPGSAGTTNGDYHSLAITPIDIGPGAYEIGVLVAQASDRALLSQTSYTLLPGITVNGGHVNTSGNFVYPGSANFISAEFAANFEAEAVSAVPEPSTLLLASLGGLILVFSRNKLRAATRRS